MGARMVARRGRVARVGSAAAPAARLGCPRRVPRQALLEGTARAGWSRGSRCDTRRSRECRAPRGAAAPARDGRRQGRGPAAAACRHSPTTASMRGREADHGTHQWTHYRLTNALTNARTNAFISGWDTGALVANYPSHQPMGWLRTRAPLVGALVAPCGATSGATMCAWLHPLVLSDPVHHVRSVPSLQRTWWTHSGHAMASRSPK